MQISGWGHFPAGGIVLSGAEGIRPVHHALICFDRQSRVIHVAPVRRLLSVDIDVNRVRANLSRECGHVVSAADVLRLLIRCGCHRWGDRWVAAAPLNMLRPDEVIDAREAAAEAADLVESIERGALALGYRWN